MDNLDLTSIGINLAIWLESPFEEEEIRKAVFDLGSVKALGPDRFPMAFFQYFWNETKDEIFEFMTEFHSRGKISKNLGASFIALVPKKKGADVIKDF